MMHSKVFILLLFVLVGSSLLAQQQDSSNPASIDTLNQSIYSNLTNTSNTYITGLSPDKGATNPSAFINYIVFDKDYNPVSAQSVPINSTSGVKQLNTVTPYVAQEIGYVFVYLSYDNATGGDVFFDDLKITQVESPVIQVNNYYPFGMRAYTWLRGGETDNAYLFQGKELIAQTGWHDFGSRMYWGDLGRWFATDPQRQFASPYLAMGNVPMMGRDPNGEWFGWDDVAAMVVGGIANVLSNAKHLHGWHGFFAYFAAGALGAEAGYITMNPEAGLETAALVSGAIGFTAGGALNIAADRSQGNKILLAQSFITGGLSALDGMELALR